MSPPAEEPLEGAGYGGRGSAPKIRPATKQDISLTLTGVAHLAVT